MTPIFVLAVFLAAYVGFALFPNRRSRTACGAALLLLLSGALAPESAANAGWAARVAAGFRLAFFGIAEEGALVSWNVMGLFVGMLILAELFLESRAPAVIAEALLSRFSSARAAMIALCAMAGILSIGVENVAVVLLFAPIALSLAKKIGMNPAPLLIGIAACSNVQGTATMIGDPPSMILAGAMKMGFFDFFVFRGRPGIFFAVEVGAIVSLLALAPVFRRYSGAFQITERERARSWTPAVLLAILIVGLCFSSTVDPEFSWFAGTLTMAMGCLGFAWNAFHAKWFHPKTLFQTLDWDTAAFLLSVFILVGGLSGSGWLDELSAYLAAHVGGSVLAAFLVFVALSTVISGFVDNVPFLLAMIPVVRDVARQMSAASSHGEELLLFGLLVGACMGGNLTPIGASANVTAIGILRRNGVNVRFRDFLRICLPFTIAAVIGSALFVWLVWA